MGCYQEPQDVISNHKDKSKRPLVLIKDSGAMTIEMCQQLALDAGYTYAALQFGGQCYAGNDISSYTNIKCDKACSGNSSQTCGEAWTNAVYRTSKASRPK